MKKLILVLIMMWLGVVISPLTAYANNEQMNATVVQLINQINAMMPLIDTAEKQQDKTTAVQFHFDTFTDVNGKEHNGLRQDLLAIRASLIAQINEPPIEPRLVLPLQQDYVGSSS